MLFLCLTFESGGFFLSLPALPARRQLALDRDLRIYGYSRGPFIYPNSYHSQVQALEAAFKFDAAAKAREAEALSMLRTIHDQELVDLRW